MQITRPAHAYKRKIQCCDTNLLAYAESWAGMSVAAASVNAGLLLLLPLLVKARTCTAWLSASALGARCLNSFMNLRQVQGNRAPA
jgi:hypothetical protein